MITNSFSWNLIPLIVVIAAILIWYFSNYKSDIWGWTIFIYFVLPVIVILLLIYGGIFWW